MKLLYMVILKSRTKAMVHRLENPHTIIPPKKPVLTEGEKVPSHSQITFEFQCVYVQFLVHIFINIHLLKRVYFIKVMNNDRICVS